MIVASARSVALSALFFFFQAEDGIRDLTVTGVQTCALPICALARRCAELGILFDVSHLNEGGFWDFAGLELGPIVATHSAAHALCQASRNLDRKSVV